MRRRSLKSHFAFCMGVHGAWRAWRVARGPRPPRPACSCSCSCQPCHTAIYHLPSGGAAVQGSSLDPLPLPLPLPSPNRSRSRSQGAGRATRQPPNTKCHQKSTMCTCNSQLGCGSSVASLAPPRATPRLGGAAFFFLLQHRFYLVH
jgi:hypothetical protein